MDKPVIWTPHTWNSKHYNSEKVTEREEDFWSQVLVPHDNFPLSCWPWIGKRSKEGYGRFFNMPAHVFAYELLRGPSHYKRITTGATKERREYLMDHLCSTPDSRACVHPYHLEEVETKPGLSVRRAERRLRLSQLVESRGYFLELPLVFAQEQYDWFLKVWNGQLGKEADKDPKQGAAGPVLKEKRRSVKEVLLRKILENEGKDPDADDVDNFGNPLGLSYIEARMEFDIRTLSELRRDAGV